MNKRNWPTVSSMLCSSSIGLECVQICTGGNSSVSYESRVPVVRLEKEKHQDMLEGLIHRSYLSEQSKVHRAMLHLVQNNQYLRLRPVPALCLHKRQANKVSGPTNRSIVRRRNRSGRLGSSSSCKALSFNDVEQLRLKP